MKNKGDYIILISSVFLCVSIFGMYHYFRNSQLTWCIFIAVAILFIFSSDAESFNFFGLISIVKRAKKEINEEAEKIKTQMILNGVIQDCHGNTREDVRDFFLTGEVGVTKEIDQFGDYLLSKLNNYISYYQLTKNKTVNAINESRKKYSVTLKKSMKDFE